MDGHILSGAARRGACSDRIIIGKICAATERQKFPQSLRLQNQRPRGIADFINDTDGIRNVKLLNWKSGDVACPINLYIRGRGFVRSSGQMRRRFSQKGAASCSTTKSDIRLVN